ncbi:MAG: RNA polymerase sigma factor [Clostridium sp.]|uniref:RNA polymerase sigma factor n=1 Tax=Clostridium sp. TaxID=1506 RepID=UPI003F30A189
MEIIIQRLIKKVRNKNDKNAASKLIELYYKDIYIYVCKQTQNEELSKDLTQEIFISVLKSIHRFDEKKASFKTWIYKIASNKIIDMYRTAYYKYETTVDEIEESVELYENSFEDIFEIQEDTKEILEKLNTFNASIQQIVRLKIFGEMTFTQIALILELPESTVKTKYYATVRKIKKMMEENNGF